MSYLALARKWRPLHFNQVVGQSHVLTALENALNQNRLHHAYLFSGTRGVGKTTIGRLFAKGLNCETGITATPCGQCATCREIDEGRFVDLLEIDAASRTKVEDTRELLDNVQYKPARGRFKVYLIDEVHMLSRHSFNALLKTLEEPPEYVKFLLATTDPQKLPVTILSRCLQFHLKPINADVIHEQLEHILTREHVGNQPRALGLIAHAADGSMRDALSLTDQAIALGNGAVTTDTVSTMLGTLDADQAIHLLEAMSTKQIDSAMLSVKDFAENGVDWDNLLQELATQLHRIAMYQALPASLDRSKPDAEKIELISQYLTPEDVQLFYQVVLKGRQDLPLAPTARMGLEMTVLRMMAFRPSKIEAASSIELPIEQGRVAKHSAVPSAKSSSPATVSDERLKQSQHSAYESTQVEHDDVLNNPSPDIDVVQPYQSEQPPLPSEDDYAAAISDEYNQQMYSDHESLGQTSAPSPVTGAESPSVEALPIEPQPGHEVEVQVEERPSIAGLRHQLRSKRQKATTTDTTVETGVKKSKAVPATSAIERVAQQHGVANAVPFQQTNTATSHSHEERASGEPYQWKAQAVSAAQESETELTPSQIKEALEHTKTLEMTQKLIEESVAQDEWAALIQQLEIPKMVEQLALNSSFNKQGTAISLTLRPPQAHLNNNKAQNELLNALNMALGEHCHLTVEIGDKGQTPLELRESIYQGKLQIAHHVLAEDKNVQFIKTRFAAELDNESVRPI
jgi:DNA polymerase-3 subunit gamma/tau